MFCTNCGKDLSEDALFCTDCGTKVSREEVGGINNTATANEEQTATIQTEESQIQSQVNQSQQQIQPQYQQQQLQQQIYQPQSQQPYMAVPPKNKSGAKKFILIGALAFIAVIALACTIGFAFFQTDIKAAFLGPKNYYLSLEKQSMEKSIHDMRIKNALSRYKYSYESEIKAKLGGDVFGDEDYAKQILDTFSKTKLKLKIEGSNEDFNDRYSTIALSGQIDGKNLADIKVAEAENKIKISFGDLTDKTIGYKLDSKSIKLQNAMLGDEKAFEEIFGISNETFNKMVERYVKEVIFESIPSENVTFQSKTKFEDIDCNSITIKLNEDNVSEILKALAEQIKADEDFKTFYKSSVKLALDMAPTEDKPSSKEIDDSIDELCDALKDAAKEVDDVDMIYTAYFNDSGKIIARNLEDKSSDSVAEFASYKSGDKNVTRCKLEADGDNLFQFLMETTTTMNKEKGTISLEVENKELVSVDYNREVGAKVGGLDAFVGTIEGKFNLKALADGEFSDFRDMDNLTFTYDSKKNDEKSLTGELKLSTKVDNKSLTLTFLADTTQSKDSSVSKPNVSIGDSISLEDEAALSDLEYEISDSLEQKISDIFLDLD